MKNGPDFTNYNEKMSSFGENYYVTFDLSVQEILDLFKLPKT